MEFDEWLKNEEIKIAEILFQLRREQIDEVSTRCHSRVEREMYGEIFLMSTTVERRRSAELKLAISCKKIISEIEELIAKKQQLEAERDKATDLDKELLLAEIEQIDDQLAEARKEYIKYKQARDELMKEYKQIQGDSMMDIMNIEKEIEDLWLNSTKQEVIIGIVDKSNLKGALKEVANLRAQRDIAYAKHEAINAQLKESRGKLIEAIKIQANALKLEN